jgi:kynurenine formamidase
MKNLFLLLPVILLFGCSRHDPVQQLMNARWVDLSHEFDDHTIYWPTNKPFSKDTSFYGFTDKGYFYASFIYTAEEHGGTHFDAPLHLAKMAERLSKFP